MNIPTLSQLLNAKHANCMILVRLIKSTTVTKVTLKDPDHPLLGPTLWGLKSSIMCRSEKGKVRIICSILFLLEILHMIFEYIEIYCKRSNLSLALRNLSITILVQISVVKIGTFIIWQKDWMKVMYFASSLEKRQLKEEDQVVREIIKKYNKYSRRITYYYWVLVATSSTFFCFVPVVFYFFSLYMSKATTEEPYPEILNVWVPFDKTKGLGYLSVTLVTVLMVYYTALSFAMYDSNAVVLMTFFAGQLEILKSNSQKLFGNGKETINYQESVRRIQKIHHHHVLLLKYSRILKCLLSPPMFLYMIMCSLMMCSSAMYLTMDEVIFAEKMWCAEYLAAQVFQLFLYCWHSQKILDVSRQVSGGVYSSMWWSQGVRVRRNVALLAGQLNKNIILTAGPFADLNIAAFVTIVKGAYSYYTLMNNLSNKK